MFIQVTRLCRVLCDDFQHAVIEIIGGKVFEPTTSKGGVRQADLA